MLALYVIAGSPAELLSHPGPRFSGSSGPARAVTVLGEKMTAQPGWGTGWGGGGSLPICDHQLLGQTPKDYSAQSLESADKAARGHLITNTIIPPGDRSATSF